MEVKLQLDVLDRQLAEHEFIADMAMWPWYGAVVLDRVYEAAEFLQAHKDENVVRWA